MPKPARTSRKRDQFKFSRAHIAIAAVALLLIAAAIWVFTGAHPKPQPGTLKSLAAGLQGWNADSVYSYPFRLEAGMLFNEDTKLPVVSTDEAFASPDRLRDHGLKDWIVEGTYEDAVTSEAKAETDILAILGLGESRQSFVNKRVTTVRSEIKGVDTSVLTEGDIEAAQLSADWQSRMQSNKAVVLVQAVIRAKELKISYLDRDRKVISGDLPKPLLKGTIEATSTSEETATEKFSNVVIGYKPYIAVDKNALPEVALDLEQKGYDIKNLSKYAMISVARDEVPQIIQLAKATAAQKAAIITNVPAEVDTAKTFRMEALKRVPPKTRFTDRVVQPQR